MELVEHNHVIAMRTGRSRWIGISIIAVVAIWLSAAWFLSSQVLRPPWYQAPSSDGRLREVENSSWHGADSDPRAAFGIAFEDVEFSAQDGSTLRGWFVPGREGSRAALVLVHGAGADRRDYLRHVPLFHTAGWPVLLFDCREQGASDGTGQGVTYGAREQFDVSSAVAWLRQERGFTRVAAMGTSQGGASVILAAAQDPGIDVVLAENPFARIDDLMWHAARDVPPVLRWPMVQFVRWRTFGMQPQPIDVVARIAPRPILLIHGEDDEVIEPEQSEQLYEKAGEPRILWIAPRARHTQVFDVHPAEYADRVLSFLEPPKVTQAPKKYSPARRS